MNLIFSRANLARVLALSIIKGASAVSTQAADSRDWPVYLGDKANSHFSDLNQVNARNVRQLEIAWTYHSAGAQDSRSQIQCNPLIVGGVLYGTSPDLDLF